MRTGETLQGGKKANKWQLAHGRSVPLLHKVLLHSASSLLLIWCRGNPRRALSFFFVFPTLPSLRPGAIFPGKRGGEKELQQAGTVEQFAELGEGSSRVKANKNMAYYVHGRYEIEPYGEETQISPTVEKPNCFVQFVYTVRTHLPLLQPRRRTMSPRRASWRPSAAPPAAGRPARSTGRGLRAERRQI